MTILNESGIPEVLSPLRAVGSLAERLPDALIFVIGTRAEAYLAQTLSAPGGGRTSPNQRVMFMILDPSETLEEGQPAARVIEAVEEAGGVKLALLVAGRSAALLGVDAELEARLAARRLGFPVKAVSPESEAAGCLCTDLEDSVLTALVETSPGVTSPMNEIVLTAPKRGGFFGSFSFRERTEESVEKLPPVVLVGALGSSRSGRELAAELRGAGIEVVGNVPAEEGDFLPLIDEGTVVALADPSLSATTQALERRGAKVVRTLAPIGADGTARFIQDVAAAIGQEYNSLIRAREVRNKLEHLRSRIRGKRIFFAGDTGLEISLARFLADAGAVVLEVGAPRLDRKALAAEIQALGSDVDIVESPDWRGQIERADAARPDVVVASPGLYVPMVARGHLCRSSLDFLHTGIHGYEGARRILELFTRTLDRAEALDSVNL